MREPRTTGAFSIGGRMTEEEAFTEMLLKLGYGEEVARKLALLKVEYMKPNHGIWNNNT